MKFKLADKVYDAGALEDLPLKFVLQLEKETAEFGHPLSYSTLRTATDDISALKTNADRAKHPDAIWVTAVSIWAARKMAGEDLTFDQAVDFPLSSLVWLPDPEDHKKPDPRKAPPRKGGGAAGNRAATASKRKTT